MADPLHDNPRSPKAAFKKKPNKKLDGYEFENIDPETRPPIIPLDALPRYRKDHYDKGGDYGHWDTDPDTKEKTYWEPVKEEKPTS